jgi:mRNA deadenylase 3'-5' endonuclease subunit Ccr4
MFLNHLIIINPIISNNNKINLIKRKEDKCYYDNKRFFELQNSLSMETSASTVDRYHRKWLDINTNYQDQPSFTMMTYNVLAQSLIKRTWYPYCEKQTLTMKYRQECIMKELTYYLSDIICMQEVDYYEEWYQPQLQKLGYTTVYTKSEAKQHGCMIAFKKDM